MPCRFISKVGLLSLLILSSGCDRKEQPYFPIDNHQTWQYQIRITTMDGTRYQKYLLKNMPAIELDNETVYPRKTAGGLTLLYNINEEGIFRIARISDQGQKIIDQPPHPVFKFPLKTGTTWQYQTTTFLLEKTGPPQQTLFRIREPVLLEYQITNVDEVVKVPAGTFRNCLRIEAQGSTNANVGNYIGKTNISIQQTYWYAPDAGLIKSIRTEKTDSLALDYGQYLIELEK